MDMKLAKAQVATMNGVEGFNLFMDDRKYGHYPTDEGRYKQSMDMALEDAFNYGYMGIAFLHPSFRDTGN